MKLTTTLGSLLVLTTLATAGCQAGGEDLDRESTEQDLSVASEDRVADRTVDSLKRDFQRRDPKAWFSKLDKDGDGRVLLSELKEGRMRERLQKADLDNDGAITLSELQSAHEKMGEKFQAMAQERFAKADKNADGKLAQDEVDAKIWEHLKLADVDGDGLLSKEELKAAHESGKLRPQHAFRGHGGRGHGEHGGPSLKGMIERFDTNKDGALALSEVPERMRERLQAADKNADGVLQEAELTSHFEEQKARFAAEHPEMAAKLNARMNGEHGHRAGALKIRPQAE